MTERSLLPVHQSLESGQAHLRAVVDHALDGLITINEIGNVESFNPACERIFGYPAAEVIGQNIKMLMPEPYLSEHDGYLSHYISTREAHIIGTAGREVNGKRKDGSAFPMDLSISAFQLADGRHFCGIIRDITERKRAEEALREAATRLRTVADTAVDGLILIDANGSLLMFNRACERLFGYGAEEMIGKNVKCLMPSPYHEEHDRYLDNYNRTGQRKIIGTGREVVGRRNDGTTFPMDLSVGETKEDGKTVFVGIIHDVTERKQAVVTEKRLTTILATIDNIVWSIAADTYETLYLNPAAERIYGRTASAFYADPKLFMSIVHPEDRLRVAQMLPELIEKGTMTIQYRVVRPDGEVRWLEDNAVIARATDGRPVRFDGVASDITERKWHEAQVLYLATYDALTNLPNRNLLSDRLTQDMARAQRGGRTVSVLVLGLDRFKLINDSYGHNFGDALLRELATRLRSSVGPGDTVARLRGDEFAVLISSLNKPQETVPAVRRLLNIFSHPFVIDHVEQYATASVGIAVFPTDGSDPEILLKNAGAAMNRAKSPGRNGFQFFAPEMNAHATERLELEKALKQALERSEFEVHYQPQVLVKTGLVVAVEALVRWRHPTKGLLPPGQFIGVAEDTGLIVPIGAWVLRAACAQNKAWQDAGLPRIRMGVNVSANQFWRGQIVQTVKRVLKKTNLPPSDLELEITESVFLRDIEETVRTLSELRSMGVAISLDDFGTGYSSLNYLRRLPIDKLKIDGSFIRDLSADPNAAVLLSQLIQLGHTMHLEVLAECVESEKEYAFLADNHCDLVQGYYLHKPLSSTELGHLLKGRR